MSSSSTRLLQLALPLIPQYGFTRQALALSVLSLPQRHTEPLSDTAVTALFGYGDEARRLLVRCWLDDARQKMREGAEGGKPVVAEVLKSRLKANEPVLEHLPEAFALLATPGVGPPFDPRPAIAHAAAIADEACHLTGYASTDISWYTQRAILAAVYTASELHQLSSPRTAYDFLESLLSASSSVDEVKLFGSYVAKSWREILKSYGIL